MPCNLLHCDNILCDNQVHPEQIETLHDHIIKCCLEAGKKNIALCQAKNSTSTKKQIPGWNRYVREHRERAIFWHQVWKSAGSPQSGIIGHTRRSTRAQCHQTVKLVKAQQDSIYMSPVAESIKSNNTKRAWEKLKAVCSKKSTIPNNMDNVEGGANIAEIFRSKYEKLFSSVRTPVSKIEYPE